MSLLLVFLAPLLLRSCSIAQIAGQRAEIAKADAEVAAMGKLDRIRGAWV